MKKLLGLLASIGLTATAGSAVVACGDPDVNNDDSGSKPEAKNINTFLEEKLDLGEVDSADIAADNAQKVINGIEELKDKVDLAKPENGKIHVSVKPDEKGLKGEADFTYKITGSDTKNINEFLKGKLDLGEFDSTDAAADKANAVIDKIAELKGKVNLADPKDGKIHVSVKPDEKDLEGEADFTYNVVVDINTFLSKEDLALGEVESTDIATANAKAIIDGISELKDKVDLAKPENGKIHVSVKPDEKGLKGEADFTYDIVAKDAKDINEILSKEDLDLGEIQVESAADITNIATDVINGIPELKGKVELAAPDKGKVHVTVKSDEPSLKGETDFIYSTGEQIKLTELFSEADLDLGEFEKGTKIKDVAEIVRDNIWGANPRLKGRFQMKSIPTEDETTGVVSFDAGSYSWDPNIEGTVTYHYVVKK